MEDYYVCQAEGKLARWRFLLRATAVKTQLNFFFYLPIYLHTCDTSLCKHLNGTIILDYVFFLIM